MRNKQDTLVKETLTVIATNFGLKDKELNDFIEGSLSSSPKSSLVDAIESTINDFIAQTELVPERKTQITGLAHYFAENMIFLQGDQWIANQFDADELEDAKSIIRMEKSYTPSPTREMMKEFLKAIAFITEGMQDAEAIIFANQELMKLSSPALDAAKMLFSELENLNISIPKNLYKNIAIACVFDAVSKNTKGDYNIQTISDDGKLLVQSILKGTEAMYHKISNVIPKDYSDTERMKVLNGIMQQEDATRANEAIRYCRFGEMSKEDSIMRAESGNTPRIIESSLVKVFGKDVLQSTENMKFVNNMIKQYRDQVKTLEKDYQLEDIVRAFTFQTKYFYKVSGVHLGADYEVGQAVQSVLNPGQGMIQPTLAISFISDNDIKSLENDMSKYSMSKGEMAKLILTVALLPTGQQEYAVQYFADLLEKNALKSSKSSVASKIDADKVVSDIDAMVDDFHKGRALPVIKTQAEAKAFIEKEDLSARKFLPRSYANNLIQLIGAMPVRPTDYDALELNSSTSSTSSATPPKRPSLGDDLPDMSRSSTSSTSYVAPPKREALPNSLPDINTIAVKSQTSKIDPALYDENIRTLKAITGFIPATELIQTGCKIYDSFTNAKIGKNLDLSKELSSNLNDKAHLTIFLKYVECYGISRGLTFDDLMKSLKLVDLVNHQKPFEEMKARYKELEHEFKAFSKTNKGFSREQYAKQFEIMNFISEQNHLVSGLREKIGEKGLKDSLNKAFDAKDVDLCIETIKSMNYSKQSFGEKIKQGGILKAATVTLVKAVDIPRVPDLYKDFTRHLGKVLQSHKSKGI